MCLPEVQDVEHGSTWSKDIEHYFTCYPGCENVESQMVKMCLPEVQDFNHVSDVNICLPQIQDVEHVST
jgi:hypothetical protein